MEKKRKFNFNPNPRPYKPKPMRAPFTPFRARPPMRPQKPKPEPEIEEPYWTAEDWEEWAEDQYLNNPDAQLPEWFVEYMEEEEE